MMNCQWYGGPLPLNSGSHYQNLNAQSALISRLTNALSMVNTSSYWVGSQYPFMTPQTLLPGLPGFRSAKKTSIVHQRFGTLKAVSQNQPISGGYKAHYRINPRH